VAAVNAWLTIITLTIVAFVLGCCVTAMFFLDRIEEIERNHATARRLDSRDAFDRAAGRWGDRP